MKATIKTLAILMMATIGFTACSDDDNNENKNLKEYALQVKFNLIPNDSTVDAQLDKTIETAMSAIGLTTSQSNDLTTSQPYLYLAARDSADAAPKVQEIGKKLEDVLDKNKSQMYGSAYIMAIEKEQLEASDSKQRSWSCWYDAKYPAAENLYLEGLWATSTSPYYVYKLEIHNSGSKAPASRKFNTGDPNGHCYEYVDPLDLNKGAGGAYLYLKMTGVSKNSHPEYRNRLITDIVMINTGKDSHYPDSVEITKNGKSRCYYPVFTADNGANGSVKHDLNNDAGGPYIWLYYTTDYRDGWVMTNNTAYGGRLFKGVSGVMGYKSYTEDKDRYYMHAYKKNAAGQWEDYGVANMNEDANRWPTDIFLFMIFRKLN